MAALLCSSTHPYRQGSHTHDSLTPPPSRPARLRTVPASPCGPRGIRSAGTARTATTCLVRAGRLARSFCLRIPGTVQATPRPESRRHPDSLDRGASHCLVPAEAVIALQAVVSALQGVCVGGKGFPPAAIAPRTQPPSPAFLHSQSHPPSPVVPFPLAGRRNRADANLAGSSVFESYMGKPHFMHVSSSGSSRFQITAARPE